MLTDTWLSALLHVNVYTLTIFSTEIFAHFSFGTFASSWVCAFYLGCMQTQQRNVRVVIFASLFVGFIDSYLAHSFCSAKSFQENDIKLLKWQQNSCCLGANNTFCVLFQRADSMCNYSSSIWILWSFEFQQQ